MFDAYVFDLDGTLIDSRADIIGAANAALLHVGKNTISVAEGIQHVGRGAHHLLGKLLPNESKEVLEIAYNYFVDYYEKNPVVNTTVYEGVYETLEILKYKPKFVVTNKSEKVAIAILKKLNLLFYFTKIIGGDTYPILKPEPYALIKIIEETSIKSQNILMVGDTDIDIQFGQNAGVKTCRFLSNFGAMGNARLVSEDFTVNSFKEILRY